MKHKWLQLTLTVTLIVIGGVALVPQSAYADPCVNSAATQFRSAASGTWSVASTWECSDDSGATWQPATSAPDYLRGPIAVRSGHTVTVATTTSIDEAVVEAGGQIVVNQNIILNVNDGPGDDLVVNGALRSKGSVVAKSTPTILLPGLNDDVAQRSPAPFPTGAEALATIIFNNGGVYQYDYQAFSGSGTTPTSTWNPGSTLEFIGCSGTTFGGLNQAFWHVTWNCTGQTGPKSLGGTLTNVGGDFTVLSTGSSYLQLTGATNYTLNIGGNFVVQAGDLALANGNVGPVVQVNGNVNQSGGKLVFQDSGSASGNTVQLRVKGNVSLTGGQTQNDSGVAKLVFNGGAAQTLQTGLPINAVVVVDSGSTVSQTTSGDSLGLDVVNGIFDLAASRVMNVQGLVNVNNGGQLLLNDDALLKTVGSAAFVHTLSGSVQLKPTSVFDVSIPGQSVNVNSGGDIRLYSEAAIALTGTSLSVNGGAMLRLIGESQIRGDNSALFTVADNAQMYIGSVDGIRLAEPGKGNLRIENRSLSFNASYTYNGTALQITGDGLPATVKNLTIDNPSGVALTAPLKITGTLALTNGSLILGLNDLTLASAITSVAGGPFSASKMVVADNGGRLCREFAGVGAFTYPIGDNVSVAEYSPAQITFNSGSFPGTACVRVTDNSHPQMPSGTNSYVTRYWTVDSSLSTPNYDASFWFVDPNDVVGSSSVMQGKKWDGSNWATIGNVTGAEIPAEGQGSFSDFTAFGNAPLAVSLASFTAEESSADGEAAALLRWETVSETDNLGFNLYRAESANGPWMQINSELIPAAAPGSAEGHSYTWLHEATRTGRAYWYRLESVDLFGVTEIVGTASLGAAPEATKPVRYWFPLIRGR